jgi:hypothetical protein
MSDLDITSSLQEFKSFFEILQCGIDKKVDLDLVAIESRRK